MKRNLLIGTSLVAAFATTNLSARSAAVMTDAAFKENTAVANSVAVAKKAITEFFSETKGLRADGTVAVSNLLARALTDEAGLKAVAGVLSAKTEEAQTPDALVAALRKQTAAQQQKSIEAIAAALATNPTLRRIVDESRTEVEALIKEEAAKKAVDDAVVNPTPAPAPAKVDTDAAETVSGLIDAMTAAVDAHESSANKVTRLNAAWKNAELVAAAKAEALEVATAAETAAGEALTRAEAELTAKEAAAKAAKTAIETLDAAKAKLTEALPATQTAAAGKPAGSAEVLALNLLQAKIAEKDAEIAAAKEKQTAADKAFEAAKAAKAAAEAALNTAKEAKAAATTAAEAAVTELSRVTDRLKTAKTDLEQKLAALETAKAAALTAAETAAKNAKEALATAKTAKGNADVAVTEAETALERATATATELAAREVSLKKERDAAREAELADTVTAKEAAVKEIVAQIADAEVALSNAKRSLAAKKAEAEKATKELEAAEKAADKTKAEFESLQLIVKTLAGNIKALKASIAATAEAVTAAKAEFEAGKKARKAERDLVAGDAEVDRLTAAAAANPTDAAIAQQLREAQANRRQLAAEKTAALQRVTETADELKKAEEAKSKAQERAREAADQAAAAQLALDAVRTENTTLESQMRALIAEAGRIPGFEAEVARLAGFEGKAEALAARVAALDTAAILGKVIVDADAEIEAQTEARDAALDRIDALKAATVVFEAVEADAEAEEEGRPAWTLADVADRDGLTTLRQLHTYLVRELDHYDATMAADAAEEASEAGDDVISEALAGQYREVVAEIEAVFEAEAAIEKATALKGQAEQFQGFDFVEGTGETSGRVAAFINAKLRQGQAMIGLVARELAAGRLYDAADMRGEFAKFKGFVAKFNEVKDLLDIELPAAEASAGHASAATAPAKASVAAVSAADEEKFAIVRELRKLVSDTDLNHEYISGVLAVARAYAARLETLDPTPEADLGLSASGWTHARSASPERVTSVAKRALNRLISALDEAEKAVAKAVATELDRLATAKANDAVYAQINAVEARVEAIKKEYREAAAAFEAGAEGRSALESEARSRLESEYADAQTARGADIERLTERADELHEQLQPVDRFDGIEEYHHNLERYNGKLKAALVNLSTALSELNDSTDADFITDEMISGVFAPRADRKSSSSDVDRDARLEAAARRNFAEFQSRVGSLGDLEAAYSALDAEYRDEDHDGLARDLAGVERELEDRAADLTDAGRRFEAITGELSALAEQKTGHQQRFATATEYLEGLAAPKARIAELEAIDDRDLTDAETEELAKLRGDVAHEGRATADADAARRDLDAIAERETALTEEKAAVEARHAELRAALVADEDYAALRSRAAGLRSELSRLDTMVADLANLQRLSGAVRDVRAEKEDEIRDLAAGVAAVVNGQILAEYEGAVVREVAPKAAAASGEATFGAAAGRMGATSTGVGFGDEPGRGRAGSFDSYDSGDATEAAAALLARLRAAAPLDGTPPRAATGRPVFSPKDAREATEASIARTARLQALLEKARAEPTSPVGEDD
ncbi:MAG: hypothetical protein H6492_00235 [Candidatus Paracaedibacteraceae bacterium]|nr:hypothetical protein [Candidatus Paracaedibacteraceae bacterium]